MDAEDSSIHQSAPYMVTVGIAGKSFQIFICAEQEVLLESKTLQDSLIDLILMYFQDSSIDLILMYFVFDISYSKSLAAIYFFFQHYISNLKDKQNVPNATFLFARNPKILELKFLAIYGIYIIYNTPIVKLCIVYNHLTFVLVLYTHMNLYVSFPQLSLKFNILLSGVKIFLQVFTWHAQFNIANVPDLLCALIRMFLLQIEQLNITATDVSANIPVQTIISSVCVLF